MKKFSHGIIAVSLFLGGMAAGQFGSSDPAAFETPKQELTRLISGAAAESHHQGNFSELAHRLSPAVVHISIAGNSMGPAGQGSGVIISSQGEILTNHHVIEGARNIRVKLSDGRNFEAQVVGTDSQTDLALLKIEGAEDLPTAELGDSDKAKVGDWVVAIGNPFGLESTVTLGVLSGKGRVIGAGPYDDFLQTDASINPGNSGGPLFNSQGEVIGINTAIIKSGQGIGFSIPINLAESIADKLRADGVVDRGYLGVGVQALDTRMRTALSLADSVRGALVSHVEARGPSARAGLKPGDIITSVAGEAVDSDRDVLAKVAELPIGEETTVTVNRDGQVMELEVSPSRRPDARKKRVRPRARMDAPGKLRLGVGLRDVPNGARVEQVFPGSPAARAGLRNGDVVLEINGQKVTGAAQLVSLVNRVNSDADMALLVERGGRTFYSLVD